MSNTLDHMMNDGHEWRFVIILPIQEVELERYSIRREPDVTVP